MNNMEPLTLKQRIQEAFTRYGSDELFDFLIRELERIGRNWALEMVGEDELVTDGYALGQNVAKKEIRSRMIIWGIDTEDDWSHDEGRDMSLQDDVREEVNNDER